MPRSWKKKVFIEPIGMYTLCAKYRSDDVSDHCSCLYATETWSYFRGDRVEVLVGKDKGKQGFVKQVIQERNWIIVDGLNCCLRKMKTEEDETKNFVYYKHELPLLVNTIKYFVPLCVCVCVNINNKYCCDFVSFKVTNEVSLVDPGDLKPTEYEWRFTAEGTHVRVSLRSGRIIPMPATAEETMDYKSKKSYHERPKDTKDIIASAITFKPKLRTFEMDIMEEMGIVENRIPKKTYWY